MLPDQSTLKPLWPPYDLLELREGQRASFTPLRHELGLMSIRTADTPAGKTITALRVWVSQGDKATVPSYWDITSQLLIADLWGQLTASGAGRRRFTLTKQGFGRASRFMVESSPAP